MALSDEERRALEILEQELAESDPELVRKLQYGTTESKDRAAATAVRGVLTMIAAFTLVIAGIAFEVSIIGVVGFLLLITGSMMLLKGLRPQQGTPEP